MTNKLRIAMERASKLPPEQQESLAALIIQEMESEQRWEQAFSDSAEELGKLAREALSEHAEGKTLPLAPNQL